MKKEFALQLAILFALSNKAATEFFVTIDEQVHTDRNAAVEQAVKLSPGNPEVWEFSKDDLPADLAGAAEDVLAGAIMSNVPANALHTAEITEAAAGAAVADAGEDNSQNLIDEISATDTGAAADATDTGAAEGAIDAAAEKLAQVTNLEAEIEKWQNDDDIDHTNIQQKTHVANLKRALKAAKKELAELTAAK